MTGWQRFGLVVLAGVAAALGHAPFGYWPVSLVGFAALIWLVSVAPRTFLIGWAGGVGYFATALHWIVEPFLVDVARHGWMAPFALIFLAGGLALFWAVAAWASARMLGSETDAGRRALGFALTLTLVEVSRAYVLTGFPWALPAYLWTDTPVRLTSAIWGPHGLTLATLVLLALPTMSTKPLFRTGLVLCTCAGLSGLMAIGKLRDGSDDLSIRPVVRLVQPNAPQDEKWDPTKAHIFVERQIEYTAADKSREPKLVVWPESAVPYRLSSALPILSRIEEAADGAEVVLGINRTEDGRHHNALVTLPPSGPGEVYDKVHLVPFGEYIPFGQLAQFVGLQSFAARDGYGFSPGREVRLIDTALGKALPLICYEAIFPQHIRKAGARPDFLLQITNDAWFGTFSGPYQHLQQAQFRATEQGLPLVRVANTGVSAMIDARGNVTEQLDLGEAAYLDTELPTALAPTPYANWGDLPVVLFLFGLIIALFAVNTRNTIARHNRSS